MQVKDLLDMLQGLPSEAEVLLYDGDLGEHYLSGSVSPGFARHTFYKTNYGESNSWSFDTNLAMLRLSQDEMKAYSIDHIHLCNAVVID